ncbi:MAG: hypothetical protein AAB439_00830 [Patescibacteria group bacterium]
MTQENPGKKDSKIKPFVPHPVLAQRKKEADRFIVATIREVLKSAGVLGAIFLALDVTDSAYAATDWFDLSPEPDSVDEFLTTYEDYQVSSR